jgi:hypothetical protein
MKSWTEVSFAPPPAPAPSRPPAPSTNGHRATGRKSVFVGIPTYNGWLKAQALLGLMLASENPETRIHIKPGYGSLLAMNFNGLWCRALNSRDEEPWTDFAMSHADIAAPAGWLETLLDERRRCGADVLSCCVAIKDDRRLTSTGVVQPDGNVRRLTVKEIYRLPETFSAADLPSIGIEGELVVNTGLWVCDFTRPWVERVCFNVGDNIQRQPNGKFCPVICPEDWKFSDWCNKNGLKVFATRKVKPVHFGEGAFNVEPSEHGWDIDQGDGNTGDGL